MSLSITGGGLEGSHLHGRLAEISGGVLCFGTKQGYVGQSATCTPFFIRMMGRAGSGVRLPPNFRQSQTAHDANWRVA